MVPSVSASSTNAITDDCSATQAAGLAPIGETHDSTEVKGKNEVVQPSHPESLSVVSESKYRCLEESASESGAPERYVMRHGGEDHLITFFEPSCSADLHRLYPSPNSSSL